MAPVFRQFANVLVTNRRTVPVGAVQIDWSHPLARDLIGAWLPGISYGVNLAGKGADLAMVTTASVVCTPEGPAFNHTANGQALSATAPPAFKGLADASIYWRGTNAGNATDNSAILWVNYDNIGSAPYAIFGLSKAIGAQDAYVIFNLGGSVNTTSHVSLSPQNGIVSLGCSVSDNTRANLAQLFQNGVNAGVDIAYGAPSTSTATSRVQIQSDTDRYLNGSTLVGYIWARRLNAAEHMQIHLDPYCLLMPTEAEPQTMFRSAVALVLNLSRRIFLKR